MVSLLEEIERNTSDIDQKTDVTLEGAKIGDRIGLIPRDTVVIKESADLDDDKTNDQGAIELSPGDKRILAEFNGGVHAVYAVGAQDATGVRYWLQVDGYPVVGPTFGSLGTVNSPFSFVEKYGGAVPADNRTRLMVQYPNDQTGDIALVGRLHIEKLTKTQ